MKLKKVIAVASSLMMLTGMISGTVFAEDGQTQVGEPVSTVESHDTPEFTGELPELKTPELLGFGESTGEIGTYADSWYPASICTENEWLILGGVNILRATNGLEPLSMFGSLQNVARTRASELSTLFEHTRPNGTDFDTAFGEAGLSGLAVMGENIASGTTSPYDVFELWANSPGHLANMLKPSYTHIGIGQNDTYWSQNFSGNDTPVSIVVVDPSDLYCLPQNNSIEDFGILLELQDEHGSSYMPLIEEMCSGLDMNTLGTQTVTIECYGLSTTINVSVDKPWKFTDVPREAWFFENVYDVYNLNIMNGLDETTFGPSGKLGRGQFATVLYRMEESPEMEYQTIYPDVANGMFYTSPAMWGKATGVITGYQNGYFGPADNVTREQVATMLYRYASSIGKDTSQRADLSSFPDHEKVSGFAREAVEWTVGVGIISGDGGNINPQGDAARAQCATMILRFLNYYN